MRPLEVHNCVDMAGQLSYFTLFNFSPQSLLYSSDDEETGSTSKQHTMNTNQICRNHKRPSECGSFNIPRAAVTSHSYPGHHFEGNDWLFLGMSLWMDRQTDILEWYSLIVGEKVLFFSFF